MSVKIGSLDLVIPSSGSVSNVVEFSSPLRRAEQLTFFGVTVTGTITIEVSPDGTNWFTLQSNGADVEITAGKATVVVVLGGWDYLRLASSGSEAAERTIVMTLMED